MMESSLCTSAKNDPLISVVIPTYNRRAYILESVESVLSQSFTEYEVLVVDDGSSDRTVEVARDSGVDQVIELKSHQGLAATFRAGLNACLQRGADIIVNTDADNPFHAGDIPRLIEPILTQQADLVIGVRPINDVRHFPWIKKILQRLGRWVVSGLTRLDIPDPTSGFRAYNREAALRLNIVSSYTYVLESIIQAANIGLRIAHVPISTNEPLRKSRLIKSTPHYLLQSVLTIFRIYLMYRPLRFFLTLGGILGGVGIAVGIRGLQTDLSGQNAEPVLPLIGAAVLLVLGFQMCLCGLIGDVIAGNRKLVEETLYRIRVMELREPDRSRAQGVS